MIAAAIGWVLVLLGVLSLRDHSGWAFEAGGSPRAWRGLRVRGLLFLTGVLLIGGGFSWARGLHRTPHWLTWALLLLGIAAMVVFAAYRPKAAIDVPRSAVARKHAAAPMRLERRSAAVWAALFAVALAAAVAVVVLALPIDLSAP